MTDKQEYLLLKRGWYYRPDNCGYTGSKLQAGRYPKSRADAAAGITAIHEDDAPDYSPECDFGTRLEIQNQMLREQLKGLGVEPVI